MLVSISIFGQQRKINAAEEDYEDFAFIESSEALLALVKDGNTSEGLYEKLANSYFLTNRMKDAALWYGRLIKDYPNANAENYFKYALALKFEERYQESDAVMEQFVALKPDELRSKAFVQNKDYLKVIEALSTNNTKLHNLNINSKYSDFGTTEIGDKIVFASSRGPGLRYNWNNQNYLDLYSAERQGETNFSNVKAFRANINSKLHESTVAFTKDGNTMFFTRNNYFRENLAKDSKGVNRLQLYRARKNKRGQWDDIEQIHFNSNSYSVAHPTLNADDTKLYFASDMPGTQGQSDIWVVDVNEDKTLGQPVNLGPSINTESQESFPFINSEGDLYFSSRGYPGLGGYDIWKVEDIEASVNKNNFENLKLKNAGKPINSSADDICYFENLNTERGYITSNRAGGKGDDDIYTFNLPPCTLTIEGLVVEEGTNESIPNASIVVYNNADEAVYQFFSDEAGVFSYETLCEESSFRAVASKAYYKDGEQSFAINKNNVDTPKITLTLVPDEPEIVVADVGTDLFELLDLNPIYFDFDKSFIRPDAEIELQKVIDYLNKYTTVKIDVRSHTDSRGSDSYNLSLSQRRNKATREYIIEKGGISPDRISGRGYGETRLINRCYNLIQCEDWEHQQNRRSEFIVISN